MPRLKLFAFIFFSIQIFLNPLYAEARNEPLKMDLKMALRLVQDRDVRLIMAHERVVQSINRITQRSSAFWPQVTAVASQRRQTRDLRSSGIQLGTSEPKVGPFNSFDARFQLTQTIFDAAAMARLKASWDNQQLTQAEFRKTREDVLALVAELYLEAKLAEERVELIKTVFKRDFLKLRLAYQQFDLGLGSDVQ